MRQKSNLAKTYACAIKMWRVAPNIPTLASGVRHVVREQGFESKDIYAQERELERKRIIRMSQGLNKTVRLTPLGEQMVGCKSVRLSPWTDPGYPGAGLTGLPRRRRKKRRKRR